jgi:hypothetical protein
MCNALELSVFVDPEVIHLQPRDSPAVRVFNTYVQKNQFGGRGKFEWLLSGRRLAGERLEDYRQPYNRNAPGAF